MRLQIKTKNMIPQIIYLILIFADLLYSANQHGKVRPKYNFWANLVSVIIVLSILYSGGFFDKLFD